MAQVWEIVGGSDKGGIIVREGVTLASELLPEKLSTGALVEEIAMQKDRLNYKILTGTGPAVGWISVRIKGAELAVKTDKKPEPATAVNGSGPANDPPLPVAIFFPGQGSQYVKMLEKAQHLPAVKDMLEKSKDILGYDILEICLNGPESKLEETMYCQPAMFIGGLAGLETLRRDKPDRVDRVSVVAGLSLGEYTALCVAGVLTFEDGLKLVKLRGEAMQEAAGQSKQLMLSVAGLDGIKLAELCEDARKQEGVGGVCSVANSLFPKGYACGGTEVAIKHLEKTTQEAGAMQAKVLKTGGAFHTSMMQPAQDKLSAALEATLPNMKPPKCTVWMNATAKPVRPGTAPADIVVNMKTQLTNTVRWEESVKAIIDEGITEWYECGPMKQLKAMMKRIDLNQWKKMENIDV